MKQITLQHREIRISDAPCLERLALTWALYGFAASLLWRCVPHDPLGDAVAWAVALLGGLALAIWSAGV